MTVDVFFKMSIDVFYVKKYLLVFALPLKTKKSEVSKQYQNENTAILLNNQCFPNTSDTLN